MTGSEIAEGFTLPPALENAWHARGYYGSVSHNVKAIYQRYMGWYDGNPANLWRHPPTAAGRRYVDYMGGADAVVARARASFDEGDFRWVAEVLSHVVFADPARITATPLGGKQAAWPEVGAMLESKDGEVIWMLPAIVPPGAGPPARAWVFLEYRAGNLIWRKR